MKTFVNGCLLNEDGPCYFEISSEKYKDLSVVKIDRKETLWNSLEYLPWICTEQFKVFQNFCVPGNLVNLSELGCFHLNAYCTKEALESENLLVVNCKRRNEHSLALDTVDSSGKSKKFLVAGERFLEEFQETQEIKEVINLAKKANEIYWRVRDRSI